MVEALVALEREREQQRRLERERQRELDLENEREQRRGVQASGKGMMGGSKDVCRRYPLLLQCLIPAHVLADAKCEFALSVYACIMHDECVQHAPQQRGARGHRRRCHGGDLPRTDQFAAAIPPGFSVRLFVTETSACMHTRAYTSHASTQDLCPLFCLGLAILCLISSQLTDPSPLRPRPPL